MVYKETKSNVTTTIISSDDGRNTYEIRKDFSEIEGITAVVIMLFPGTSYLDIHKTDSTSQSLINHVEELGINRLRMVNLFSKVCSARMSVKNIQPDNENLTYIETIMKEQGADSYEWVIAWGSSMLTSKVANQMKRQVILGIKRHLPNVTLKQFMVENLDNMQSDSALHPLFLKIRYSTSSWLLEEYKILKELLMPDTKEKIKQHLKSNADNTDKQNDATEKGKKQIKGNAKYVIQK